MEDLVAPPTGAYSGIKKEWYSPHSDFEILDFVQRGGFGTVFKGRRISTGERVALKFFDYRQTQISDASWIDIEIDRQFEANEIAGFARILGVFYDTEDGLLRSKGIAKRKNDLVRRQKVTVMELLDGGEVYERVEKLAQKGLKFSEQDASIILESVVKAFDQLHARRRINPDFKPENCVFVHEDPRSFDIKVIDLGLVRLIPEGQSMLHYPPPPGMLGLGTPKFLAPESRAPRSVYSPLSDVFQLGCFLYTTLCAHHPFDDAGIKSQWYDYCQQNLSDSAKSLLEAMLEETPEHRISLHDILAHPFVRDRASLSDADLGEDYIARIRSLNLRKRFRGLLQACADSGRRQRDAVVKLDGWGEAGKAPQDAGSLSGKLKTETFMQVKEHFLQRCDRNVRQKISHDAFKGVLTECGLSALARDEVVQVFDPDREGTIGYVDFIVALTAFRYPESTKLDPQGLFDILDLNSDGKVTKEEIVAVLRMMLHTTRDEEDDLNALFETIDVDGQDGIDMKELKAFLDHNNTTRLKSGATLKTTTTTTGLSGLWNVFGFGDN